MLIMVSICLDAAYGYSRFASCRAPVKAERAREIPSPSILMSVPGRDDSDVLNHKDHGSVWSAGTMQHSLRNNRALSRTKFIRAPFEINQELPLDHIEKFVIVIVLVPVILALHNPKTNHGTIHLPDSLVGPLVLAGSRVR